MGKDNSFNITENLTIAAWIKGDGPGGGFGLIKSQAPAEYQYSLYCGGGGPAPNAVAFYYSGEHEFEVSDSAACDNTWHHVVITKTSMGVLTFYIDGQMGGSRYGITLTSRPDAPLRMGSRIDSSYSFFGNIDEVVLWNRALTAEEVQYFYNNGNTRRPR